MSNHTDCTQPDMWSRAFPRRQMDPFTTAKWMKFYVIFHNCSNAEKVRIQKKIVKLLNLQGYNTYDFEALLHAYEKATPSKEELKLAYSMIQEAQEEVTYSDKLMASLVDGEKKVE